MTGRMATAAGWLMERRKCTLDMAFTDLRDYARCYVDEANTMLEDWERKFPFALHERAGPITKFVVSGFPFGTKEPEDKVEVVYSLHRDKIEITPDLTVTQRWNPRTGTCALRFEGEEWTAEQISQIALDRLFFT